MRYLHRQLESEALKAARHFPAVVLTGLLRAQALTWQEFVSHAVAT
jgi:hypothetical protein